MSERGGRWHLEDMIEAAIKIIRHTQVDDMVSFLSIEKTFEAVIGNFEIKGEAVGRMDEEFKSENTEFS